MGQMARRRPTAQTSGFAVTLAITANSRKSAGFGFSMGLSSSECAIPHLSGIPSELISKSCTTHLVRKPSKFAESSSLVFGASADGEPFLTT